VLLLPLVLTQDGPAHVYGAWVLLHHGDQDAVGAALREHYDVDLSPVPNMLTTLLLTVLLAVLGPDAAEKVVLGGFVLLVTAALRYALRGVDRRAGWLAVLALPLAGGQLVAYGFYNFCWGVTLALFVIGLGLRRRPGWDPGRTAAAALLLALTWTAHALPWVLAAGVLGGLAAGRWVVAVRAGAPVLPAARIHLLPPVLAGLPSVALTAAYLAQGGGEHGAVGGAPDLGRVAALLSLYRPLVVASAWEVVPAVAVAVVLAGLTRAALRGWPRPADEPDRPAGEVDRSALVRADRVVLGAATVLSIAAALLTPSRLGREFGFLHERLAWFPPLLLVLFCATRVPRRLVLQQVAAVVVVVAATAAVAIRLPTQLADQREAAELLSVADALPAGSTFAVLRFSGHEAELAPLAGEPDPLRHLSGRLAVEVGGVDIGHYEAVFPYFQVRFSAEPGVREAVDPGLDGLDVVPPTVHLLAAGQHLDHVLVVGLDRADEWVREAHRTAQVLTDLRAGYQQVAESGPSGLVSVWRLRDTTTG